MKVHQYCSFALKSETMSAADITARLGMVPDEVMVLGSKSAERRVPRSHSWKIVHRGANRVDDQIEHVISRLAPVRPGIRTLVDEGASAVLQVVRYSIIGTVAKSSAGTFPRPCSLSSPKRRPHWTSTNTT